jgi:hypothetical protein
MACGTGEELAAMAAPAASVSAFGVDLSEHTIVDARRRGLHTRQTS